ncbi:MAG TPA: GNAT family N-acetyltransferase [Rhabdochlamydiaceae bacterium]|nr:GNAT family N-acetyltransferase [Rhabdochlamydiaceae bacterium]
MLEITQEPQIASTVEQIKRCYGVMKQLRSHLKEDVFIEQIQRQIAAGYQLIYLEEAGEVVAVAGFRFLEFLAWGKVLYIDGLVTDFEARGKGYGGKLIKWLIERAKVEKCDQVHLDGGPQRHDAHRLYLNHGFKIIGYHFSLDRLKDS